MTWFKVDDHLHSHRKAMRAGTEAMGLWVLAGSWSAAEESDGWVPAYVLPRLVGTNGDELAERLTAAGLWHADEHDGEAGYRFHAWAEYQPTKATLERKRADQRERMREARAKSKPRENLEVGTPAPKADKPPKAPAGEPAGFAEFWSEYPRKIGKAQAVKAYAKATKDTEAAVVLEGLRNAVQVWRATNTEDKFIPHAATWLNAGRWEDEQPMPGMPQPGAPAGPSRTLAQCDGTACPGGRHEWSDARNNYMCMGV